MVTFRVHLSDGSKIDVQSETAEGARKKANSKAKSGVFVVKTKVVTAKDSPIEQGAQALFNAPGTVLEVVPIMDTDFIKQMIENGKRRL